jgi:hypothetical protein
MSRTHCYRRSSVKRWSEHQVAVTRHRGGTPVGCICRSTSRKVSLSFTGNSEFAMLRWLMPSTSNTFTYRIGILDRYFGALQCTAQHHSTSTALHCGGALCTALHTRRERRVSAHLCIRGHGMGEHERGRTSARELALPHYCLPGQHSASDRVQNQNRADASEREGRAPAGAHSTAHTTRATRECASMHTRTWRGRARARTHLGTRAGAAPATRAHSSGRQPRTAGECSCRCPQHSAHDANNTRECASMHTRVMAWESTSVDAPRHTSCWRWPLDRAAEPRRRIRGRWISLARMNLQLQCPGHPRKNGIGAAVFG